VSKLLPPVRTWTVKAVSGPGLDEPDACGDARPIGDDGGACPGDANAERWATAGDNASDRRRLRREHLADTPRLSRARHHRHLDERLRGRRRRFRLAAAARSDSGNDQHDEPYDDQSPQHPYRRKRQPPTPGAMRLDDPWT